MTILDGLRRNQRARRRRNFAYWVIVILVALLVFSLFGELPEMEVWIP